MNYLITAAGGLALMAGACLLRSEYEKDHFVTEYFEITSPKIHGEDKKFVFLTDLHDKEFGPGNEKLVEAIRKEKPDAILIGGDMMVCKGKTDLRRSLSLIGKLCEIAPVFHGNGNHEQRMERERDVYGDFYDQYRKSLDQMGVTYLSDSRISYDKDIVISGVDLPQEVYRPFYPKLPGGFLEETLGAPDPDRFQILLAHSPMFFKEYRSWGADLVLSGHFHGGTIRIPGIGGLMTPQYQFFYPYCAGIFRENGSTMIVGRGLGTHSVNVRLFNKPQLVVIRVKKQETTTSCGKPLF